MDLAGFDALLVGITVLFAGLDCARLTAGCPHAVFEVLWIDVIAVFFACRMRGAFLNTPCRILASLIAEQGVIRRCGIVFVIGLGAEDFIFRAGALITADERDLECISVLEHRRGEDAVSDFIGVEMPDFFSSRALNVIDERASLDDDFSRLGLGIFDGIIELVSDEQVSFKHLRVVAVIFSIHLEHVRNAPVIMHFASRKKQAARSHSEDTETRS